ncbi:MAG: insulinase family protein [Acidobacteria bacterium]|nr:insulinase family protein [Acidobacteriota bacterium]
MRWLLGVLAAGVLSAQVKLPAFTRQTLSNGATVILMPRRELPLVTVNVTVRGGAESDPDGMGGLASVTAELLRRGAGNRSAARFAEDLDALGATFLSQVSQQATTVSLEFLEKDAEAALSLLGEALTTPQFPEDEVKKAIAQRADSVRGSKDNPMMSTGIYYRAFYYPQGHPYARPLNGDEASLAGIGRKDAAAYHARHYVGRNISVAVAGSFEVPKLMPLLAKALGGLPAGAAYAWRRAAGAPALTAPRLLLVDKPDATQTYFYIGQPGIDHNHPDRAALSIVNTVFGGRFTSILNDELRVNTGLTYGANSTVERDRLTGSIYIATFTRTATTAQAIDKALELLRKLASAGLNTEQLASAKAYIKGTYPTDRLETSDQLVNLVQELALFEQNRGEVDDLFSRLDAVTLEQANAAARRFYGSPNLVFVLVGNAAEIRPQVKKWAADVVEIPVSRPGFDAR